MLKLRVALLIYDIFFAGLAIGLLLALPNYYLILWIFLGLVWYGYRFTLWFRVTGIPHPKPTPFFGNVGEWMKKNYIEAMRQWGQRFGDIYGLYFGRGPVVVIADANVFEQVMAMQEPRPNVFEVTDDVHRKQRRILLPAFNSLTLKAMWPLMSEACEVLTDKLATAAREHPGEPVNLHAWLQSMTMDVIGSTSLGQKFSAQTDPQAPIVQSSNAVFNSAAAEKPTVFMPLSVMFPPLVPLWVVMQGLLTDLGRGLRAARVFLESEAKKMVKQREQQHAVATATQQQSGDYKDLLELMLLARDGTSDRKLSEKEVLANAQLFVLAGYETTANTLTFAIYLLAKHPEWQDRLYAEVAAAAAAHRIPGSQRTGDTDALTHDVLLSLPPLVDAVLNESLRLYPVGAVNMRELSDDMQVGPYMLPKGTLVMGAIHIMHRDPRYWSQPDAFRPDRFLDSDAKQTRPQFAFAPWGAGPRSCIGMRFAQTEARLALAKLVLGFRFALAGPSTQDPLPLKTGITLSPRDGLWVVPTPR